MQPQPQPQPQIQDAYRQVEAQLQAARARGHELTAAELLQVLEYVYGLQALGHAVLDQQLQEVIVTAADAEDSAEGLAPETADAILRVLKAAKAALAPTHPDLVAELEGAAVLVRSLADEDEDGTAAPSADLEVL